MHPVKQFEICPSCSKVFCEGIQNIIKEYMRFQENEARRIYDSCTENDENSDDECVEPEKKYLCKFETPTPDEVRICMEVLQFVFSSYPENPSQYYTIIKVPLNMRKPCRCRAKQKKVSDTDPETQVQRISMEEMEYDEHDGEFMPEEPRKKRTSKSRKKSKSKRKSTSTQ